MINDGFLGGLNRTVKNLGPYIHPYTVLYSLYGPIRSYKTGLNSILTWALLNIASILSLDNKFNWTLSYRADSTIPNDYNSNCRYKRKEEIDTKESLHVQEMILNKTG